MNDVLSDVIKDFQTLYALLVFPQAHNQNYYVQLSMATEEAYFTLNKRMDTFLKICERSIEYRDFVRVVMEVLGEVEASSSVAIHLSDILEELTIRTRELIERINDILSSSEGSRLRHGLPL